MASKKKNVDTIAAPAIPVVNPEEPLLSIIEPKVKNKISPPNDKPKFWPRHHRKIGIALIAFSLVLLFSTLVVGGAYAYQQQYKAKIFPGVKVWGVDAGGKNGSELQRLITDKINTYKLTVKGPDQDYQATAEDLGVNYDSEATITNAFAKGRTGSIVKDNLTRAHLLLTLFDWQPWQKLIHADDVAITPAILVNEEKFNGYMSKIADNIKISAQDSQVIVAAGQMQLKPAIYGREVNLNDLKNQAKQSIDGFVAEEIIVKTNTVKPAIIDDAAQEVMIQAQNVMQRPVILTYQGTEYRPNQETVASWISFVKNTGDTKYTLVVDPSKMAGYFDFLGSKINIYPVSRKIRVENSVKETETRAGSNGLLIDTALLGKTIAEKLPVQASVTIAIPTYVAQYKTEYERVIIADWDKYIDINLSTQTMTACEKGGVNCRQWYVMTGKNSTPTPTGTWLVQQPAHSSNFWMSDAARTYNLWVPYATWFKGGGYAIHSAQWRNNDINSSNGFGNMAYTWNGSHGCVNSPDDAAEYIFNWAVTGTPVIVHY